MSEEIKTILCNDIEIPVEFLKQNFVTIDGKKYIELQQENKRLKESKETAINYIDQVIMYESCAKEIDEELNTLIGILRGDFNE